MTGVWQFGLEFGAVGVRETADVAGELDDGDLKAETDAEERQIVLPGPANGLHHATDSPLTEAARYQQPVVARRGAGPRWPDR